MTEERRRPGGGASARGEQLAFELPLEPRFGEEDFLVGASNEQAYGAIESWPDWPDQILLLCGPEGSGKSHLAAIWAERSQARIVAARDVTMERVPDLVAGPALVVEDADREGRDEAALFHLLNLARERKTFVLFTCATAPAAWGLATADLLSRLRLAPSVSLEPPDDALLKAVLVKLFVDRQLVVDIQVVDAIALRIERSLAMAARIVAALDRKALQRGRRITRHLAMQVLDEFATMPEEEIEHSHDEGGQDET